MVPAVSVDLTVTVLIAEDEKSSPFVKVTGPGPQEGFPGGAGAFQVTVEDQLAPKPLKSIW